MISSGTENSEAVLSSTSTPSSKRSLNQTGDECDQSSTTKKQCGKNNTLDDVVVPDGANKVIQKIQQIEKDDS